MQGASGVLLGEPGEKLGMSRLGESGAIKHRLGDRVGDDGVGASGEHVGDRALDRRDRGRRARRIGMPRLGGDLLGEPHHRQRAGKAARRVLGRYGADRHLEAEPARAARQRLRVGEQIERRQCKLVAPEIGRQRDVGPDPGRLAEGQRQRSSHVRLLGGA
jgi:hypothetical protein